MEIKSHFKQIRKVILEELANSKKSIQVAVAWFTNYDLFDKLCSKLSEGIEVELIIIDDEINNKIGGLNFQKFINLGGELYYGNNETPMHHKFCVIDDKVLITGSYNWTYFAENINFENITIFKGVSDILTSFEEEFEQIKSQLSVVKNARQYDVISQNFKSRFDLRNYLATDIYQHALEEQNNGNNQNALNLINFSLNIMPDNEEFKAKRFEIRNVVYRKWNEDYIIDKIEIKEDKSVFYFRTHIVNGAWVHSPNAKYAWKLRNTQNMNQLLNCTAIKNIALNGRVIVTELSDISILSFKDPKVEKSFEQLVSEEFNELGLKFMKDGKVVDEKGRKVKLIKHNFDNKDELTCEIHFPPLTNDFNFVDLLEGVEAIDKTNHWHCFDIEINRNREVQ